MRNKNRRATIRIIRMFSALILPLKIARDIGRTLGFATMLLFISSNLGNAQILVADNRNNSVLEYDSAGHFLRTFVTAGSGGLNQPGCVVFGPDGNVYVSSVASPTAILRYNGQTGAFMGNFVPPGEGGALNLTGITFGQNGNLFAADYTAVNVKEYDGTTGAFLRVFATTAVPSVTAGTGQVVTSQPSEPLFGPDGYFYLAAEADIEEFDGSSGAFVKFFPQGPNVADIEPSAITFGPDGNLYVGTSGACCPEVMGEILKYDATTGSLLGVFVPAGSGGLQAVGHMEFRPDGFLYVLTSNTAGDDSAKKILRYSATTGAFVDVFIDSGNGGLVSASNFTFVPTNPVSFNVCPLFDQTKAYKSGSTLPIKLQLCDINGNDVSSPTIGVHAVGLTMISANAPATLADAGNANPDNNFRFESQISDRGGYIFNLSLKGLAMGTYSLNFTIDTSPTLRSLTFQVK
ncbi:MAG TPA: hypothetical protein VIX17_29195 [Pyrinomonadaceae bacterium]